MVDSFSWQAPPEFQNNPDTSEWCRAITLTVEELAEAVNGTPTYTVTNGTDSRTFDADTVTTAQLADVLHTLIADLQDKGVLG